MIEKTSLKEGSENPYIANNGGSDLFYSIHKNSRNDLAFNYKKFKCLDQ